MNNLKTNIWSLYLNDTKNIAFDEFPITKLPRPYIKYRKNHCESGDKVFCLYEEGTFYIVKQAYPAENLIYVIDESNRQERVFFYNSVINVKDIMERLGVDRTGKKIKLMNGDSIFDSGEYYFIIYKLKRKNVGVVYDISKKILKPIKFNNLKLFKSHCKILRIKSMSNFDLFLSDYKDKDVNESNIVKLFYFKVMKGN